MEVRYIQMALWKHHYQLPEDDEADFYAFVLSTHYSIGSGVENYPNYFESVYQMICRDI